MWVKLTSPGQLCLSKTQLTFRQCLILNSLILKGKMWYYRLAKDTKYPIPELTLKVCHYMMLLRLLTMINKLSVLINLTSNKLYILNLFLELVSQGWQYTDVHVNKENQWFPIILTSCSKRTLFAGHQASGSVVTDIATCLSFCWFKNS